MVNSFDFQPHAKRPPILKRGFSPRGLGQIWLRNKPILRLRGPHRVMKALISYFYQVEEVFTIFLDVMYDTRCKSHRNDFLASI